MNLSAIIAARHRVAAAAYLLDDYTGATAGYSLRNLTNSWTSSDVVLVRRSSDSAESGFTATEVSDGTMLTWVGTGGTDNGFVKTWYDQSGNANNATQSTAANQPKIVSSGSVILVNGKPNVQFTNTSQSNLVLTSSIWTYTGSSTLFHTSRNRSTGASKYGSVISQFGSSNTSLGINWQKFPNSATQACTDVYSPGGVSTSGTQSVNTQYLATFQWQNWSTHKTNGNTIIAINGVNQTLSAYGANPSSLTITPPRIGTFDNVIDGSFLGDIQEIVIYTTALTQTDIDGAETNINDFYSIY
jgi:hypothetical protein